MDKERIQSFNLQVWVKSYIIKGNKRKIIEWFGRNRNFIWDVAESDNSLLWEKNSKLLIEINKFEYQLESLIQYRN